MRKIKGKVNGFESRRKSKKPPVSIGLVPIGTVAGLQYGENHLFVSPIKADKDVIVCLARSEKNGEYSLETFYTGTPCVLLDQKIAFFPEYDIGKTTTLINLMGRGENFFFTPAQNAPEDEYAEMSQLKNVLFYNIKTDVCTDMTGMPVPSVTKKTFDYPVVELEPRV
ncbi:MAG: hypothetical protein WC774_05910 [Candidatus Gracilibacteria bacterium]